MQSFKFLNWAKSTANSSTANHKKNPDQVMEPVTQPHDRPGYMDFSLWHWLAFNALSAILCQNISFPVRLLVYVHGLVKSETPKRQFLPYRPVCYTKAEISRLSASQIRNLNPVFGGSGPALTGLRNLGNTCYMNSILQCLCNAPHLADYFNRNLYHDDINR